MRHYDVLASPTSPEQIALKQRNRAGSLANPVESAIVPNTDMPAHLQGLLDQPNPAVICTVRQDGQPVSVATWYLYEEGRIVVNMDAGRKRLDYLRHEPRVSLTVLDHTGWYTHISLTGTVIALRDDPDLRDIDRIAQHYIHAPYGDRQRPRITALIDVTSWHAWGPNAKASH
jgi:PPOX class probable F420-dependent enzyme